MTILRIVFCVTIYFMLLVIPKHSEALPKCEGSPASPVSGDNYFNSISQYWHNCNGELKHSLFGKYVGEWKDGKRHGNGVWTSDLSAGYPGVIYVGEFKHDKFDGRGTLTWILPSKWAGMKYVGEYKNHKMHGKGTLIYNRPHPHAGQRYAGEFKNNKANGLGRLTFVSPHPHAGKKFAGKFKDGLFIEY